MSDGWISVKDRLPEVSSGVWVSSGVEVWITDGDDIPAIATHWKPVIVPSPPETRNRVEYAVELGVRERFGESKLVRREIIQTFAGPETETLLAAERALEKCLVILLAPHGPDEYCAINGLTNEELLGVVIDRLEVLKKSQVPIVYDRLEAIQEGNFTVDFYHHALDYARESLLWLKCRSKYEKEKPLLAKERRQLENEKDAIK